MEWSWLPRAPRRVGEAHGGLWVELGRTAAFSPRPPLCHPAGADRRRGHAHRRRGQRGDEESTGSRDPLARGSTRRPFLRPPERGRGGRRDRGGG